MSSNADQGNLAAIIIIDDDSDVQNSTPIIIIDDDSNIENPAADLNTKSSASQSDFNANFQQSVVARKQVVSLIKRGYELNEAKMLVSTSAGENGAWLDNSIPNAPKWGITGGVLPVSNEFKLEPSPEVETFTNIRNENTFFQEHNNQNFNEYVEDKSFYSSFENNFQGNYLSQTAQSQIIQQYEQPSSSTELKYQPRVHIKPVSNRRWITKSERQLRARKLKVSNNNDFIRNRFAIQEHSTSFFNDFIGIELAIIPIRFPEENLQMYQFKALQETILDQILRINRNDIKPSFIRSYITTNELVIACSNEDTADWLKTVVHQIKQWDGITLQVVHRSNFPRRYYVIGYLPNSRGMSYRNILNFIDAQNHGFNIAQWRILIKIDRAYSTFVKFSMDYGSIETLRANEWKIYFKLKRIKLTLVGSRKIQRPQQF